MPKMLILWILSMLFIYSCTKDQGSQTKSSALGTGKTTQKFLDTTIKDHVLDTAKIDYSSYKNYIENPGNGYIKTLSSEKYDLEIMYRPISYETLIGMETFDQKSYKRNHKDKAQVLSFSIKRTDKSPSVFSKTRKFNLYIQDDRVQSKLEPVYFLSDHKLGGTEVFYCVFDRSAATKLQGDVLHLVWTEGDTQQDIYYTKRILKQDFTTIYNVN